MDVFKYSLQTSALQLIHLTFLSRVAQIIFHSRRSFYLKCQNCRICGFHTVFIWSKAPLNEKERENRLCFFSIPCFVRVLKVTRLVSAGAFHMLQLSACIWHLRVTSVKAGKEMTSSPSLCSLALSLSGALIFKRWTREAESFVVRWDSECHLSGRSCVNWVWGIGLWQWGDKKVTVWNPCQKQTTS